MSAAGSADGPDGAAGPVAYAGGSALADGWRLAVGTLSVVRVRPPSRVDAATARWAVRLAPLAVLPLGLGVAVVVWLGGRLGVPSLAVGLLAVGLLVLGTRALHVDGLSDTADGLTASYDASRSLAVMRSGSSGPAGTAAVVIVLGLQAAGFAGLAEWSRLAVRPGSLLVFNGAPTTWQLGLTWGAVQPMLLAGLVVCLSRWALLLTCRTGVPDARAAADPGPHGEAPGGPAAGLGSPFAGVVPITAAVGGWLLAALLLVLLTGSVVVGLVTAALAVGAALLLVARVRRRLGGTTGDVYGAAIELTLAILVVGSAHLAGPFG